MPLRNLAWFLVVPAIVGLALAISFSAPPPDRDYDRVRQIVNVLAEVDANFYRELSEKEKQQLVEDMINGGLQKLDRHSEYFNADQLKRFESDAQGSFGGVGILLTLDPPTKFLKVNHPTPGTPAYEAGIIADDLIVKIGDTSTEGTTIPDARKLIVGEPGTQVKLTVRRAGRNPADEEVTLTRAQIAQHPVSGVRRRADDPNKWEWFLDKPNGIGYIRLSAFNELTTKELRAAVEEIERDGGKALVLDLRDNPGGLLNQAVDVVDLFLTEGRIVSTRDRRNKERVLEAKKDGTLFLPAEQKHIAVLVNDGSASASEIVSAALQDHKRAVVIGERTYGKGSVQKLLRLGGEGDQKAAVKLTTETYWRPSGVNIDRVRAPEDAPDQWGVKPDIDVPMTKEEKMRADLEQLKLQWVAGKPGVEGLKPGPAPTPKGLDGKPLMDDSKPFVDQPLNKALEVLKKKIGGLGFAPPLPRRLPEMISG
ncbi:S41 family peptidase [Gemmata sp. G18]|uniref:S41 family peptidase n=1 Tax=Gemmata palustris TaxID=2822762 RepID=A0ABS5C504_9BACT|nr:S41 family peptidase [Gemmata palustris]MBP3960223.1 S41 family peptidase [Gemmata palustris]